MTTCAYCGQPSEGQYSIHRDGYSLGPEVPLCDACGQGDSPSLTQIWARIGQSDVCESCDEEIRSGDARRGSFHEWCLDTSEGA